MAVEIRNLTIHCELEPDGSRAEPRGDEARLAQALRALRRDMMAECDRRIAEALRRQRER